MLQYRKIDMYFVSIFILQHQNNTVMLQNNASKVVAVPNRQKIPKKIDCRAKIKLGRIQSK